MPHLKIDNNELTTMPGTTILEAARSLGIYIPTLCNNDNVGHYTSCMVCIVKDHASGRFLPSCTAPAMDGMNIDTSGDEVTGLQKKSVEMLLSEHRADCEAPCRVVCPAGYNIPLMNRLISSGNFINAKTLSVDQTKSEQLWCINCPGYCQNACRRKKIDTEISIKNLQLFISPPEDKTDDNNEVIDRLSEIRKTRFPKKNNRFFSLAGKITESELYEWLKECDNDNQRFSDISDYDSARYEASACMHCDCRASEKCKLRELGDKFALKNTGGKMVNAGAVKKINRKINLIFENAKCIKCGLCVRICEDSKLEPGLCFINRGFVTILSEPLTNSFEEVLKSKAKECIDICPTGALAWFKIDPADETNL
jgi:predicted molibdopterin-dependent oxidoreductase YjgC